MTATANLYPRRRARNFVWTILAYAATALGLSMLAIILATLVWNGFGGLSLEVFTKNTAPPGVAGGLLNSIVGSVIMTAIGLAIGAPLGILAGTYLAEYGANSRLAFVVRFINDILLSAPSIIVGLFIYELLVVTVGHFSALAGGVALAVLGAPIMVRTTEDMLNLVPNSLREAASALGMPRSRVIRNVAYRAVASGIITGILLAIARMTGETAPLIFTALGNSLFSADPRGPMSALPLIIYEFARSPYAEQQRLAWTGALILTFAVLGLSVIARVLSASVKQK
jgi:phosphate transport system permease protein